MREYPRISGGKQGGFWRPKPRVPGEIPGFPAKARGFVFSPKWSTPALSFRPRNPGFPGTKGGLLANLWYTVWDFEIGLFDSRKGIHYSADQKSFLFQGSAAPV